MTGKTHAIIGANVVWVLQPSVVAAVPWLIPVGALSGLLADLDASQSMVKHVGVSIGSGKHQITIQPFSPIAIVMSSFFRHRGWLHSGIAVVVVAIISFIGLGRYGEEYPIVITLGYASHLAIDALTKHGIEFLLPFRRAFHLLPKALRARTGGMMDMLLFLVGALGLVLYVMQVLGVKTTTNTYF